ncbi:hypothetical protein ABO04_05000 [Nitrosomonas sp. HPC101]|nr:hypothetical protein [Nitrosomonas sp. HPC101]
MNMENNVSHSDLDDLIPPVIEVSVAGEVIAVTPIKVKELTAFAQAIAPLLQALGGGVGQNWADLNISTLLMNHTDTVIRAVAIGIRREVEFVNNLDIDELIKLGNAVVEVNVDFFIQKVLPEIKQGVGRIVSMAEQHNHADGQSSI